jgi:hypothetical protein
MLKALIIAGQDAGVQQAILTELIEEGRLFEASTDTEVETVLLDLSTALDYDLFVIIGTPPALSDTARINFEKSLQDGAGLLILHDDPGSEKALAAPVRVHYLNHHHPVARGVRDFEVTALIASPLIAPPSTPHSVVATASSMHEADPDVSVCPAMISASHGRGRAFHCFIGAIDATGNSPIASCEPLRRALARAAEWAATGNVLDF